MKTLEDMIDEFRRGLNLDEARTNVDKAYIIGKMMRAYAAFHPEKVRALLEAHMANMDVAIVPIAIHPGVAADFGWAELLKEFRLDKPVGKSDV